MINNIIIVGALVEKNGKILLVQENRPDDKSVHKKWNTPAGHLDSGENIFEGAKREVKEETGLDIELEGLVGCYVFNKKDCTVLKIVFKAKVIGGKLKFPENEILNVKWFRPEEILNMKNSELRHIRKEIEDFKNGKNFPLEIFNFERVK